MFTSVLISSMFFHFLMKLDDAVVQEAPAESSRWFEDGADDIHDELVGKGGCSRQLRKLGGGLYALQ
jgi:hypothetical protein